MKNKTKSIEIGDAVAFTYDNDHYDCGELVEISGSGLMATVVTVRGRMFLPYDSLEPYTPSKKVLMAKLGDWVEFAPPGSHKKKQGQIVAINTERFPFSYNVYCPADGVTHKKVTLPHCSKAWVNNLEIILD